MPPKRKAASAASEAISSIQAPTTRLTRSRSDASAKKPKLESTITLLKEGDQLPDDLSPVTTDAGEEVRVQDLAKESGLLIFFYPRANTPGCTTQACGFRDSYEEVVADGWKVYGMSYGKCLFFKKRSYLVCSGEGMPCAGCVVGWKIWRWVRSIG
jgi:peroxiredoxin Q/BCP